MVYTYAGKKRLISKYKLPNKGLLMIRNYEKSFSNAEILRKLKSLVKKETLENQLKNQLKKVQDEIRLIRRDLSNSFPQNLEDILE